MLRAAALAGMTEREFWSTTPRFFMLRVYAHKENHRAVSRNAYEVARYAEFLNLYSRIGKGKTLRLTDMGKFPWEKPSVTGPIFSPEEAEKRLANMDAAFARMEAKAAAAAETNAPPTPASEA